MTLAVATVVEQCWQPVPGGSGTYVVELLRAMRDRPDVGVRGLAAAHRSAPDPDNAPGVPVTHAPLPRQVLYETWNRTGLPRAEHLLRPAPDVVHAPTWALPGTRRPLVVTVHDVAFLRDASHFTDRGVRYFRRALERVRAEADAVIVPSRTTWDDCVDAGIDAARLELVPHGVRVRRSPSSALEDFRRRHGLVRPYVLWTGTREPRKNLTTLLAAFDLLAPTLPDVELVLVGPAGWGPTPEPAAHARVRFLGRLSWDDLQLAYGAAAAFCYPSSWEGFGMPVLEAMAHGVPVVTSAGTSTAEVGGDAALLVDPTDADALAEALTTALGPQGAALGRRGRARADTFTWERAAAETTRVLRSVVR